MAPVSATQRLDELLSGPVGRDNLDELVGHIYRDYHSVDLAHSRIKELQADLEKLEGEAQRDLTEKVGILHFVMGQYQDAVAELATVRTRKTASHFLGRAHLELGNDAEGMSCLEKGRAGDDDLATDVLMIEAHCRLREDAQAEALLKPQAERHGEEADYAYARGLMADLRGEYGEAMAHYEAALAKNPAHVRSMFRLALDCDLNGEDERAMGLYRRCAALTPTYIGALIDLGVLYEDHAKYMEAIECYKRVLAIDPRHKRAQLYLKDAESSLNMFIDLSRMRSLERMHEIFSLPVSNFELSARSRSTLDRMDIKTLGGLTQVTREELLSEKNFGDTSLGEIENLLSRYDLELGRGAPEAAATAQREAAEDAALREKLSMSVEELDFSTRCRRCMERLVVSTVSDLIQRTEAELLNTPNFGATSLQEVKRKLAALGLSLKGE
jgi:DNA-directed RNA polymerase subunit alpha